MIRMTAIVSSIVRLLGAASGAVRRSLSNRCATSPAVAGLRPLSIVLLAVAGIFLTAEVARAQDPPVRASSSPSTSEQSTTSSVLEFLGGGALALGAHEGGHLLFDAIFDSNPRLKKVSFHGIPFFAITHDSGLPPTQEFVIDSAGFWVQEATNEWMLTRHPQLRHEHAPLLKGMFAFNVGASFAYAGAAFAQAGPAERDTRGMADALRWKEPYVGLLILAPAILDSVRYLNPDAKWAAWGSRAAKIFGVVLIVRP
jgi:hypothetical protein